MKTAYDWHADRRGEILVPEGSSSAQQTVVVSAALGHDVLWMLYISDRLAGQALDDARAKYGAVA